MKRFEKAERVFNAKIRVQIFDVLKFCTVLNI